MHLLASKPGGFNDEEGIVDLEQSPADVVILSAADSSLAALAGAAELLPDSYPSIRLANLMQLLKPASFDLYEQKVLSKARVLVVSLLGGSNYWQYGYERMLAWAEADSSRTLIIVPGDDAYDAELFKASTVPEHDVKHIWQYLRQGGVFNNNQLFLFLASNYLQLDYRWQQPIGLPRCLIYPAGADYQQENEVSFDAAISLASWQKRWFDRVSNTSASVCLVLFYRSHLQSANIGMFEALFEVIEAEGLKPLPIAVSSLKDEESISFVNEILLETDARLIINTTSFACNTVSAPDLSSDPSTFVSSFSRSIPVLQLLLSSSTEEDWQNYSQGLRSRDIAMQIVLPEMDGRIVTRAVSFKSEAYFSERCEISLVRYQLHQERAQFVARLAYAYCQLSTTNNVEKRVALILANYPTKDGRIGNGVGLDTPESVVNILQAMAGAGYPLQGLPENGTELIKSLLESVTNNPNTLHSLPCWQSISVQDYQKHFKALPIAAQNAVLDRWGPVENDPKYRADRIMLAGLRLGEIFVGIQPARGFNVDLLANYHDPDLVPPHSYLAFYFWLRHCYQVSAVIHVGKHGNLEWLPGKGSALSDECWPDIALGPMPHFYPFIVNDPGEGAQAKRRTQAVIIDHLMPPMARAELYGDLSELEVLVDEYYQALGMDSRREEWLIQEILLQVNKGNVLQELGLSDAPEESLVLEELDAYLCDIKEAQIRNGLHILGELPKQAKLVETMVALLRLPRGSDAKNQGILHNLAADLGLMQRNNSVEQGDLTQSEFFDPLAASVDVWQGARPDLLRDIDGSIWRTEADTRERLELVVTNWIDCYVLQQQAMDDAFRAAYPQTAIQLSYAKAVLLRALQQSATNEIGALIGGLSGEFVEPGPSGAPTRGRLDTLPTGRNFFSVDNRSIPSQAAWAIGQRSAQALLDRHLQDHGEYPAQIGLSVWGTATMRTGGDDIAQAFYLMGIKPIWMVGSQRVVDFEIIPAVLLNRPRVDVTLRVSGFFRDAFPNVMRLYDAAVQALATYDDPGGLNVIKNNIKQRFDELKALGVSDDDARRQASYRVFGSKPGAYGAGLQGLIDERCWEERSDLAEAYLNWGGFAYGNDKETEDGVDAKDAFKNRLSGLQVIVQNQDNREHDILDSDDYYQFQGGMSNAVREFSSKTPTVYNPDHSNPSMPKIRTLKEELNRVLRTRVLNPKWIGAMQEHGYKGAFEMSASVDYLFAYDATTDQVDDYQYEMVTDALVLNDKNQAFLKEHNAPALEEMSERLLEAMQRGLWAEPGEYQDKVQGLLLEIDEGKEQVGH